MHNSTDVRTYGFWFSYVPNRCCSPWNTLSGGRSLCTVSWYSRVIVASRTPSIPNFWHTVAHRFSFQVTKSSSILNEDQRMGEGERNVINTRKKCCQEQERQRERHVVNHEHSLPSTSRSTSMLLCCSRWQKVDMNLKGTPLDMSIAFPGVGRWGQRLNNKWSWLNCWSAKQIGALYAYITCIQSRPFMV